MTALPQFQDLSLSDPHAKSILGPLYDFVGTWTNQPNEGWNLIAVPGPADTSKPVVSGFDANHGFILETIPYTEVTTYEPISLTLNRGEFVTSTPSFGPPEAKQQVQRIGAVLYEQRITSEGPPHHADEHTRKWFDSRGFAKGKPIHAEQGMLLNIQTEQDYGSQSFQVARLGTIPHGNSVLCLGTVETQSTPGIQSDGTVAAPTPVDPSRTLPVEYGIATYDSPDHTPTGYPFSPHFNPQEPNATLVSANKDVKFKANATRHLSLSTANGTGGVLSLPFVAGGFDHTGIDTTKMTVDYWISTVENGDGEVLRLQYVQNINLVFPATSDPGLPINWPHIGLNTLHKVLTS